MKTRNPQLYSVFLTTIILFLVLSCSENSDPVSPEESQITIDVIFAPMEVKSTDGKVNLMYSVEVSNFEMEGYTLKDFQVLNVSGNSLLCSIQDTNKYLLIHKPMLESIPDEYYYYALYDHVTYRFSVGLVLNPVDVPAKVKHRLVLLKNGEEKIIEGEEVEVQHGPIPIISPPLKGERFVSARTTTLVNNHHPSTQVTYKGKTKVPTRFCVDWNKIDDAGNAYDGDSQIYSNWYVYGQNVYAVADGQIISVSDGMPDQSPVGTVSEDINLFNGDGNNVVMFVAGGGYVLYAHLMPNSITVRVGQEVERGTLLGRVGNSGSSYAPHLHFGFHTDFPYYISEGLPYYIDSLEKIGSTGKPGGPYVKLPSPEIHTNEIVENCGVYNLR